MAPEKDAPTAAEKGKGKAIEDGKSKDGKVNGKKEDEPKIGELGGSAGIWLTSRC